MINSLKKEKEEFQLNLQLIQENNKKLNEELEKYRKIHKDSNRKEFTYKNFQEKLDQSKNSEKLWNEEKNSLNEKLKGFKADLIRKEAFNKELKEKLDHVISQLEKFKELQEENEKLKENLKKYKNDVERKETAIELLKGKLDECLNETNQIKVNKATKSFNSEQEKENQKLEFSNSTLKKSQNQTQILIYLIKRLFRDNYTNIKKIKNRLLSTKNEKLNSNGITYDEKTLSESLNILKLSPQELCEFLEPKTKDNNNEKEEKLMEKFEFTINNFENLDGNEIYLMIYNLIEERIKLEKKI